MGNTNSRSHYPSRYPSKHGYYSDTAPRIRSRKGGGAGRYLDDMDYDYSEPDPYPHHSYSRYPQHSSHRPRHGYDLYPNQPPPVIPPPLSYPPITSQGGYPIVPPMPPPMNYYPTSGQAPVIPQTSYSTRPNMQMPVPNVQPPAPTPVIPPQPTSNPAPPPGQYNSMPIIPPPTAFSQGYNQQPQSDPSPDMYEDEPLGPGQYGPRNPLFERPESIHFRRNPLPEPPTDLFERSPFVRLLQDLRRPMEEVLSEKTTTTTTTPPRYTTGYVISPPGSYASREKKPRKGLLRSLSNRLTGKGRRDHEPRNGAPVAQPVIYAMPGSANIQTGVVYPPGSIAATMSPAMGMQGGSSHMHQPPPSPTHSHRSHRSRHSHHSHRHSPRQESIKIDEDGHYSGLSHLSRHPVHWERKAYPTAYHLLEALRFKDTRPDLAEYIRTCQNTDEVRDVVAQNAAFGRPNWEEVGKQVMEEVLYNKFMQHPDLRRLLLRTGNAPLVFNYEQDTFWGKGMNELGKALERVRSQLLSEGF